MFLPFVIIVIASVTVYLAWDTCKNRKEQLVLLAIYALIVGVCVRYAQSAHYAGGLGSSEGGLSEAFKVNMPDVDEAIKESEDEKRAADEAKDGDNEVDRLVKATVKRGKRNISRFEDVNTDNGGGAGDMDGEEDMMDGEEFDMASNIADGKGGRHIQSVFNPSLVVNVPQAPVVSGNTVDLDLDAHLDAANLGLSNRQKQGGSKTTSLGAHVNPKLAAILGSANGGQVNTDNSRYGTPAGNREQYMLDIERRQQSNGRSSGTGNEGFAGQYQSPSPGFSRTCGGSRANVAPNVDAQDPLVAHTYRRGASGSTEGFTSRRQPVKSKSRSNNKKSGKGGGKAGGKEGFTISGRARAAVERREFCQKRADEQNLTGSRETDYLARCIDRQQGNRDFIATEEEQESQDMGNWDTEGREYNSAYRNAMGSREETPGNLEGRIAGTTPRDSDAPPDAGVSWSKHVEERWHESDRPGRPRFANWMAAYQDHSPGDPAPFPAGKLDPKTLTNRTYVPGMTYMPPSEWSVPQYHPTYCRQPCPGCPHNEFRLRGMAGRQSERDPEVGLFPLEMGQDGTIAKTEDEVTVGNVGYMMPKFEYREYVDCQRPARKGGKPRHQPGMGWGDMPKS